MRDNNRLEACCSRAVQGIITVTDLLRAYIQQYATKGLMGIESMMQTQVITATPAMSLAEA